MPGFRFKLGATVCVNVCSANDIAGLTSVRNLQLKSECRSTARRVAKEPLASSRAGMGHVRWHLQVQVQWA